MEMQEEWIHYFFAHCAIVLDKWQTRVHIKSLENWKEKRGNLCTWQQLHFLFCFT